MKKWTKEYARLIGRIIFADFLEHSLEKYRSIIEEVERSWLFERIPITIKRLFEAQFSNGKEAISSGVIAEIARSGRTFSIRYTHECFNKRYIVGNVPISESSPPWRDFSVKRSNADKDLEGELGEPGPSRTGLGQGMMIAGQENPKFAIRHEVKRVPDPKYEISGFLHKLRRINSRNELMHRIIKGIVKHQRKYLRNNDPIKLAPFSQVYLVKWLNSQWLNGDTITNEIKHIDNTWVSRLIKGISVIVPSREEKPLRWFFQTQKDVNKRLVKQLLDKENADLESGDIDEPLTDDRIRAKLQSEYGVKLSRHSIGHCRKDMGIPPSKKRLSGYKYPPLSADFSNFYPLTVESVQSNAPAGSGIYEFRLKGEEMEYPASNATVIYIGSTKNIRKRLTEHLRANNKNGHIKHFLKNFDCSFRYIRFLKNWKEEEKR